MNEYKSWGRHFHYRHKARRINWRNDDLSFMASSDLPMLPYGFGHSYGDVCLNDGGLLIDAANLNRFISFDPDEGIVRCEAGVSLAEILQLVIPHGWFLPVLPGTKFVTVGGAVGNDVHGKNHHRAGSFGRHVTRFELVRSDGSRTVCSPSQNAELFRATIGGLGLTGLITWVELQLRKVDSPNIDAEFIKFGNVSEFFELNEKSEKSHEYTVAWVDCLAKGAKLGRGIYMRGNHVQTDQRMDRAEFAKLNFRQKISVPLDFPAIALNKWSVMAFNFLYNFKQRQNIVCKTVDLDSFFTPLDFVGNWNRIYGKRGFYQYQFVIPNENEKAARRIFEIVSASGQASFLVVLKKFGDLKSPGLMSFAKPGITLALDFPNRGKITLDLFNKLNEVVLSNGGRLNPSKDSIMSPEFFRASFPDLIEFEKYRDPKFSSSFWRRVHGT